MNGVTFSPAVLALLAFCIVAEVVRELCFKVAAARARDTQLSYAVALSREPRIWIGVLVWGTELLAWLLVLQQLPLGIAFPIMALTYAAIPLACMVLLREQLSSSQLAGTVLVAAGVVCVGLSGH